jgi:hypothetical protein
MTRWLPFVLGVWSHIGGSVCAQDLTLRLPPVKTSITLGEQSIAITAAGVITGHPNSLQNTFRLLLTADMTELQEHLTALLKAQLDSEGRCGDRLSVTAAALVPASPSGALTANIHYERWVCAKVLGKEVNKKLLGGDGVVPVSLTPTVEGSEVKLTAEVGTIEAKGALGEALRSAPVRDRLRDRIGASVQAALQGGTNFRAILPAAIERAATLQSARFTDAGSGHLAFELAAEVRMSAAEIGSIIGR